MNASGKEKYDGCYPKILEQIYEWEREEAENLIWKAFHKEGMIDWALYLPQLKYYDGIGALKEALAKYRIPSYRSVMVSRVLYESTGDDQYLDIIKQNIDKEENEISFVSMLAYCTPSKKAYNFLVKIYLRSDNSTIRSAAITGILYNKGIITDPHDIQEYNRTLELHRKFMATDMNDRKRIIEMLEMEPNI